MSLLSIAPRMERDLGHVAAAEFGWKLENAPSLAKARVRSRLGIGTARVSKRSPADNKFPGAQGNTTTVVNTAFSG
jgi:hypothetical protein